MVSYTVKNYGLSRTKYTEYCFRINNVPQVSLIIQTNNLGEFYFWNKDNTFLRVNFKLK